MSHVTADKKVHRGPVREEPKAPHDYSGSSQVLQGNFCCLSYKLCVQPDLG